MTGQKGLLDTTYHVILQHDNSVANTKFTAAVKATSSRAVCCLKTIYPETIYARCACTMLAPGQM